MKKATVIFIQALGTFSILATALPLLTLEAWYVRVFDYPRMQIFSLALLCLALFWWLGTKNRIRDKFLIGGLAVAIVYQAINIFPYTFLAPSEVKRVDQANAGEDALLSIMVANVLMTNDKFDDLVALAKEKNPDILLLLESDSVWEREVRPVTKDYRYRVEIPLSNTYGMHLYSQLPLRQQRVSYLLDKEIPSVKTFVQLRSGTWVEFHAVHPKPPVPTEDPNSKKRDAEIVMVARDIEDSKYPVVVAGDFNDVAWSQSTELFQEVSRLLDPRIGRGFYNTFNARYPLLRWPLDHIFHSKHFKLVEIERLADIGSDHFPIYIKLSFAPENKYEQEEPEADGDTQQEATETIQEGQAEARKD
ncbi:endonuclease/exonuclease/phosphatase family protein [Pontibacter sp. E15-1]|uniref:endonuclease/exonuclease/phosphatase family protein n=1 Tax=Pontibacter sp. E15-1 TaxID=2919918 RepID=UPI001F4F8F72|nr:endonuclease/exonuclease/phosphatase family protein [Pontibacter sp. E15-1]MCJ8163886.1 endonuclease/exonuclease/phosphatase family protein [Pontibacter sp. E15-1]